MDRQETDDEARSTKKTGNMLYWILGIGIALMLLAVVYGLTRHDGDAVPKDDTPASQMMSDTVAGDGMANDMASDTMR